MPGADSKQLPLSAAGATEDEVGVLQELVMLRTQCNMDRVRLTRPRTAVVVTATASCLIAVAARGSYASEDSSPIWIYCQSEASGSKPAQVFGYFIFDQKRESFKEYDLVERTVTNVHATIEDDSISWVKTFEAVIVGPQQMHTEERYSIDRRSLAAVERRETSWTALSEGVPKAGTIVDTYYGRCKKIANLPIRSRQL